MIMYWCMFLLPALALLTPRRLPASQAKVAWVIVGAFFALIIGFRFEVGSDWFTYLNHFDMVAAMSFREALSFKDPAYYGVSWIVSKLGGDKTWVNFVSAICLMWGTVVFSRRQPLPWLALLVAVPYMLIVVGMGYTRQGAALGLALLALSALGDGRLKRFVFFALAGATFHKSAVLLLPIAGLSASRNRLLTAALMVVAMIGTYFLLIESSADFLWQTYVGDQKQSEGGAVRVMMNAVPAVLFLLFRKRLVVDEEERKLWIWMSLFALACIPMLAFASTAVDRIALYMIPLQMYVFSRLPGLARTTATRTPFVLAIIAYYAAVQFVWLNFAGHAGDWLPYRFAPFV
ncbi:EpsG family protein [Luteimonas fraxinea]|uniref:EpsG family protein n=1 Tax=Luteimonas fraxinea TaxID=2901869 RepID=A0ABS8UFK4_9GAMM|nr:EpsG family protein [Luteimonas fraxinea]MCD9097670.1 EpsG family protein [Luteimonas fraxinea]UHH08569.1 EpsG family protein [Luteimonas fraxinea]